MRKRKGDKTIKKPAIGASAKAKPVPQNSVKQKYQEPNNWRIGPEDKPGSKPVPEPAPNPTPTPTQIVEGVLIDGQDAMEIIQAAELDADQELSEASLDPDFYVDIGEPGSPCIIRIFRDREQPMINISDLTDEQLESFATDILCELSARAAYHGTDEDARRVGRILRDRREQSVPRYDNVSWGISPRFDPDDWMGEDLMKQ